MSKPIGLNIFEGSCDVNVIFGDIVRNCAREVTGEVNQVGTASIMDTVVLNLYEEIWRYYNA